MKKKANSKNFGFKETQNNLILDKTHFEFNWQLLRGNILPYVCQSKTMKMRIF